MRRIILSVACIGLLCSFATAKTWKSKSGNTSLRGEFQEIDDDDKVVIRIDDSGKIVRIALDNLRKMDRDHVLQLTGRDNKVLKMLKDDPLGLGIYYKNDGEIEKARELFNEALEKESDKANAFKSLGDIALGHDGDHNEAIDFYDKAIEANPEYAGAYKARGLAKLVKDEADHGSERDNEAQRHMNRMVRENMRDHPWEPLSSLEYETPLQRMAKLDFEKSLYLERLHIAEGPGPGVGVPGPGPGPPVLAKGYGIAIGLGLAYGLGDGAGEIKPDEAEAVAGTGIFGTLKLSPPADYKPEEPEPQQGEGEAVGTTGIFGALVSKLGSYKAPEQAEESQPEEDENAQVAVGESVGSGLAGGLLKHAGWSPTSENEE